MKRFIVALVVVVSLACVERAIADPIGNVVGTYAVQGTNADRSLYTAEAEIKLVEGDTEMAVVSYYLDGQLAAFGFALREGNILSVIFQSADQTIGSAFFTIKGKRLEGVWFLPPTQLARGTEIFTRIPKLSPIAPTEPREHTHTPGIAL